MARAAFGAIAALLLACAGARADPPPYKAAIVRLSVPDQTPFSAFVWYPSKATERPWQAGSWSVAATQGAPAATGQRFPLIVFAQGGENPLMHGHLAAALARRGFVVVMPIYGTAAHHLLLRPHEAERALAAARTDPRFAPITDPARVGMIGQSLGGAVGLILAGGRPDPTRYAAYCHAHAGDSGACRDGAAPAQGPIAEPLQPLKALILLNPLSAPFDAEGLAAVQVPLLLYRPENGEAALESALPQAPALRTIPSDLDTKPSRENQSALRDQIESEIVSFLQAHL